MMPSGIVIPVRVLIGDLDSPSVYSDTRLSQVIAVAAKQVQMHLSFTQTYVIDYTALTITPDPTAEATLDDDFSMLVALKSACFIDTNTLRAKAAMAGLRATIGSLSLDTSNNLQGYLKTVEMGPCAMFEDLSVDYAYGNINLWKAILSPFINNQFDPRYLGANPTVRDRGFWSYNGDIK